MSELISAGIVLQSGLSVETDACGRLRFRIGDAESALDTFDSSAFVRWLCEHKVSTRLAQAGGGV